jgi:hypothetical protein
MWLRAMQRPDDSDRATTGSDRHSELVKLRPHSHKTLVDVFGLADESIDLLQLAVDDKDGGLTWGSFLCGNLSIPFRPPLCHPCLSKIHHISSIQDFSAPLRVCSISSPDFLLESNFCVMCHILFLCVSFAYLIFLNSPDLLSRYVNTAIQKLIQYIFTLLPCLDKFAPFALEKALSLETIHV